MSNNQFYAPDERLDDLQNGGLRILQKPKSFCFGMDAVLLAYFTRLRSGDRVADMGTGTGILPLLMSRMEPSAHFYAFEWQHNMADMAKRSVLLNALQDRIDVYDEDFRNAAKRLGTASMDAVVCNPPYGKQGGIIPSDTEAHLLSRHETECALADTVAVCAAVLKNHGRLWMVFPAARALELMDALRKCRLEPKRLRTVCVKASKAPYLVLVEAVKNARPTLHWLPPLIVHREDGTDTDELRAIYGGGETPTLPECADDESDEM
ncbi:MAG: tRNA1(Val) (adenine(37)-N6)-methyltransferase [Eubacteriales bacterium]|nr:tRNA1(Val) (adenine(37)-N6)-methyltransferase [Eubacteriales bacterium]